MQLHATGVNISDFEVQVEDRECCCGRSASTSTIEVTIHAVSEHYLKHHSLRLKFQMQLTVG